MTVDAVVPQDPTETALQDSFSRSIQEWELPVTEEFLEEILSYIFSKYWDRIIFGPLIEGASYEMVCPQAPTSIDHSNGFLTIFFGEQHFHLCIGSGGAEFANKPARMPGRATIFRKLDQDGAPISWGLEIWNIQGQPMMTIFFDNPFATRGDVLLDPPEFERLAMWRDISARYLGRPPEEFDASGSGHQPVTID